jgi:uncharacterized protein (DUF608 family)
MPDQTRREFLRSSFGASAAIVTRAKLPDDDYRRSILAERSLLAYWPLDGDLKPARGEAIGTAMRGDPVFVDGPESGKVLDIRDGRFVTFGLLSDLETVEGTVELFFKLTAPPLRTYNPCLIAKRNSSSATRWSIHVMNDLASIGIWNGRELANATPADGPIIVDRWYHLAVTSKPDEGMRVYVDGVQSPLQSGEALFNQEQKGLPLQIGASAPDGAEAITAQMAEVAIYGAALSGQAIARHVDAAGLREHRREVEREKSRREQERNQLRAEKLAKWLNDPRLFDRGKPQVYEGASLEAIRFTVGGIGAGCIQMNGKGERAVWQIFNNFAAGSVPNSFLAIRAKTKDGLPVVRALQTATAGPFQPLPGGTFRGAYPFAWYDFASGDLPLHVSMEVFNPLIPMDAKSSAIPCAIFRVTLENRLATPVEGSLLGVQQNAVGYDGKGQILDKRFAGYGGNRNKVERWHDAVLVNMTSDRPITDPAFGSMSLACLEKGASGTASVDSLRSLRDSWSSTGRIDGVTEAGPSPAGSTLDGAIIAPFKLNPGGKRTITVILTWHFPNAKHGGEIAGWSHEGNRYARWWQSASAVADHVATHFKELYASTRAYHDALYASNLPHWLLDRISSQVAILRSKTTFWAADDYFGAWEGCAPESGCCAGSCTHVWHYAQAHARLFPELARKMRAATYSYQRPDGGLPHRHPSFDPATDGHLGDILGAYREHLTSTDGKWLDALWPKVKKAMEFAIKTWDPDEDGTLSGSQWNTLDGDLGGSTTWLGSLYLSALAACERMASAHGDGAFSDRCKKIRLAGAQKQNETLWNGEYYVQKRDPQPRHDYSDGCEIDQLLGEWWARQVGLDTHFPEDRSKSALSSIVRYNFRPDFHGVVQLPRKFVADDDPGTQMIQWPKGGRPTPTILYGDEVMSGFEYAASATMVQMGMLREGFMLALAASDRYDGRLRTGLTPAATASWGYSGNPFGDDECGKYYARAMSVWSLLLACQGFLYEGPAKRIGFLPVWKPEDHASFFSASEGWGLFTQTRKGPKLKAVLDLRWGTLMVKEFILASTESGSPKASVRAAGKSVGSNVSVADGRAVVTFAREVLLKTGDKLSVELS